MKQHCVDIFSFICVMVVLFFTAIDVHAQEQGSPDYSVKEVPFSSVQLTDALWASRITLNNTVSVPNFIEKCYNHGRIDNFKKAGGLMSGYFNTSFTFDDADVYKCIEALAYHYQTNPSATIEKQMDELISYVVAAQEDDGYILTAWTAGKPGQLHSWLGSGKFETEPQNSHETFTLGHLYDAAIAHYQSTGQRTLLDVAIKNANLLVDYYLKGGSNHEPGHELIEMSLIRLYLLTQNDDYLKLSNYLIELRGRGVMHHDYSQDHKPVTEQSEAVGHAVRAAYLYCGMADIAAMMHNQSYLQSVDKIWENVVGQKLYITGGIGSKGENEGFSKNYDLPNETAYCESCAAIANVMWNWRLFKIHEESKYIDVLERTLYNNVLSSTGLDGTTYFYPNRLETKGDVERSPWFDCACCPSSIIRFIPTIPGYFYAYKNDSIYVNLFAEGSAEIPMGDGKVVISQHTNYPWNGVVDITIEKTENVPYTLLIRIPGWAKGEAIPSSLYRYTQYSTSSTSISVNGKEIDATPTYKGYVAIHRQWHKGDIIRLDFPMTTNKVKGHESITEDKNKLAYERGPIVYCAEEVDNRNQLSCMYAPSLSDVEIENDDILNSIVRLNIHGKKYVYDSETGKPKQQPTIIRMIPYYAWNNRGKSAMKVWIPVIGRTDELTLGDVTDTDTLSYHVQLVVSNGKKTIQLPRKEIAESLGLTIAQLINAYGKTVSFNAVEPNHNIYTSTLPSHGFDKNGYVTSTPDNTYLYSEFSPSSYTLTIWQNPAKCRDGDKVIIEQSFTYVPTSYTGGEKMRRVVLKTDVTIGTSTQIDTPPVTNNQQSINNQTYTLSSTRAGNGYKGIIIKNNNKYLKK